MDHYESDFGELVIRDAQDNYDNREDRDDADG